MKTISLTLALCLLAPAALAQPATCRAWTGMEVPYIGDSSLDTLGGATFDKKGRANVTLNPDLLQTYPAVVRDFWLAHACAHHAIHPSKLTESVADCEAVRKMVKKRKLKSESQLQELISALGALPEGEWGEHAPDAGRLQQFPACFNE